jgi:hypothetical protein
MVVSHVPPLQFHINTASFLIKDLKIEHEDLLRMCVYIYIYIYIIVSRLVKLVLPISPKSDYQPNGGQ